MKIKVAGETLTFAQYLGTPAATAKAAKYAQETFGISPDLIRVEGGGHFLQVAFYLPGFPKELMESLNGGEEEQ